MSELYTQVREFFDVYERALAGGDAATISALYADAFMFGDPRGVQPVKKEDFLRVLPRRAEFFRSAGLLSSNLESVEASPLDARYVLVKTVWVMRFARGAGEPALSRNSASYILQTAADSFQIVFQLDHQDLAERARQ
jgi:ketosteroid isomerase-like protein